MLADYWPLLGLRLRVGPVELRPPSDADLSALAAVAFEGMQKPGTRTFLTPWTDLPPMDRARHVVQGVWSGRGEWTPEDWSLHLGVFVDGVAVGMQGVLGSSFGLLREVRTWSWLGLPHQGAGLGTTMRQAALHLAFAELGAACASTASFVDNPAPLRVSRKLGYEDDGITRDLLHGEVVVSQRLRLSRERWAAQPRPDVAISGLSADCLALFGAN
ncbi:putative succinyl-CoA transferase [Asanoa ishikariensis]|uniref:Protein N-acetyltransferase, RimJ/RimL family n=1 Tax=Asanoa ishikariensis TaxID=137265 RepID=A0A1H3TRZ0_9ACTN|nr:GNAT family N-acetyltransferase [Asanoa ishikariensis]GIF67391.1 putative succinyl-CoA transferase [Asanoa ishikariensis]SDZ53014.1 Protein N-acetyltransferase, RimJ/RimL family [Asanoa ishikariensis]